MEIHFIKIISSQTCKLLIFLLNVTNYNKVNRSPPPRRRPETGLCVGGGEQSESWNTHYLCSLVSRHEWSRPSVKRNISKLLLFCKKRLTATLSYTELRSTNDMYKMTTACSRITKRRAGYPTCQSIFSPQWLDSPLGA
jgi:hypothetical protein